MKKILSLIIMCAAAAMISVLLNGITESVKSDTASCTRVSVKTCPPAPYAVIAVWTANYNYSNMIANENGEVELFVENGLCTKIHYIRVVDSNCIQYPCNHYFVPANTNYAEIDGDCIRDCKPCSNDTRLYQNYPNPFNPVTNIKFTLPNEGYVKLTVYDITGKEIVTLVDGITKAGFNSVDFDGSNLSSGFYFYKLETPEYNKIMKMVLTK